ncbi:hypothetical protein V1281_000262 [Nitrobacteraceae bacterium AZCC 2161]
MVAANSFALPRHPHEGASVDIVLDKASPLTPARKAVFASCTMAGVDSFVAVGLIVC